MHSSNVSRRVRLPGFWQCVVIAAALCVGWMLWKEFREQVANSARRSDEFQNDHDGSEIEEVADDPVASLHTVEAFVRLGRGAVPRLIAELSASDPRSRALAVHGLATIGPAAANALIHVRERLTDESPEVRACAIRALRSISQDPDESGRVAAQMLADPDDKVRDAAAAQLLLIGPEATKVVLARLEDDRAASRGQALRVLCGWTQRRPEGWPEWLAEVRVPVRALLEDSDSAVRTAALTAVVAWGIAEPDDIRELLHHEDYARVDVALSVIPGLEERAAEFLPDVMELIDRLKIDDVPAPGNHITPGRMDRILRALKTMQTAARPAAPRLIRLLEARHDYTRTSIAETLVVVGTDTDDLVRVLTPLILDEDRGVAYHAGRLLVKVSPTAAREQVSVLVPQLGSGTHVNKTVLFALHALGPEAREAAPHVAPLVKNSDSWVSQFAKHVINDITAAPERTPPAGR